MRPCTFAAGWTCSAVYSDQCAVSAQPVACLALHSTVSGIDVQDLLTEFSLLCARVFYRFYFNIHASL
jgi:hypothetical protein